MTKEQAIEKIKWSIHISKLTKDINGSNASINVEVLETVLSMLEQKDKIIDLMLNEITNNAINTCPLEDYNYDLDCENKCNDNYKECWKQYFENKAKEEK